MDRCLERCLDDGDKCTGANYDYSDGIENAVCILYRDVLPFPVIVIHVDESSSEEDSTSEEKSSAEEESTSTEEDSDSDSESTSTSESGSYESHHHRHSKSKSRSKGRSHSREHRRHKHKGKGRHGGKSKHKGRGRRHRREVADEVDPGHNRLRRGAQSKCKRGAQVVFKREVTHVRPIIGCSSGTTRRPVRTTSTTTRRTTTSTSTMETTTVRVHYPKGTKCDEKQETQMIKVRDAKLNDRNSIEVCLFYFIQLTHVRFQITDVSKQHCERICKKNKRPNGQKIACRSVSYSFDRCLISTKAASPNELTTQIGSTYFEKVCFY